MAITLRRQAFSCSFLSSSRIACPWSTLVAAQPATDALLRFLSPRDVVCWLVSALEAGDATTERLLTRLRPRLVSDDRVLHCAVAHGCLRAACRLRRRVRRQRAALRPQHPVDDCDSDVDAKLTRWIDTFRPLQLPPGVVLAAAARGDLRVVRWLHATTRYEPLRAMRGAAQRGHLQVVQWLAENFATARRWSGRGSAAEVTVDVRLRLRETNGMAVAWSVTRWQDEGLQVKQQQPTHSRGFHETRRRATFTHFLATRRGFAPPVHSNDAAQLVYDAPRYAAATSDLELLEHLHVNRKQHNWRFSTRSLEAALGAGHVDAAEWLTRHAGVTTHRLDMKSVLVGAIRKDHLCVLKWCRAADQEQFEGYFALATMMLCSHLDILQWSYALAPSSPWSPGVLLAMAKSGLWDSVKWVYATFPHMTAVRELVDAAAAAGDLDAFRIARDRLPVNASSAAVTDRTLELACESGNLALVQTVVRDHSVWSAFGASRAASAGYVDIVEWLLSCSGMGRFSVVPESLASSCARSGHYECAEWLLQNLPRSFKQTFPSQGHFEAGESFKVRDASPSHVAWDPPSRALPWRQRFVELVLRHRPEMIMDAPFVGAWAARNGLCGIVTQLIEMEYPFMFTKLNLRHILKTTEAGWIVRAFLERHPDWLDLEIVRWAAKFCQLSVLPFVFANHCVFPDADTRFAAHAVISSASRFGHLEILQWMLRSRDDTSFKNKLSFTATSHDPWKGALACAAAGDHAEIVQWLLVQDLVDARSIRHAVRTAIRSDSARVLELLRDADLLTCSVTLRDLFGAMSRGSVRVVKWIVERCPEVLRGVDNRTLKVVERFLHSQPPCLLL